MRLEAGLTFAAVLFGCNLGLDEDQIDGGAGAGGTLTSAGATSSSGATMTSASGSPSSTASGDGGDGGAPTSTSATSAGSTSSSTDPVAQVACLNQSFDVVMCAPGEVCCVSQGGSFASCERACAGSQHTFACDDAEDCPMGEACCAPQEEDGDISCAASCSDDDTICSSDADCADACVEDFSGPLGQAYVTCF